MKKNLKRLMCIFIALLMAVSIVACGNGSSGGGGGSSGSGGASREEFVGGPLDPFKETVTITWAVSSDPNQMFIGDDNYDNNTWTRRLLEDLNINLEVGVSIDSNDYDDRIRLLMVSNDLPDIFTTYDRNFFNEAQRAGQLRELDTLLANNGTPGLLQYPGLFPDSFVGGKIDGTQYGFPVMDDNFHTSNFMWIRDDWLENTNSQPPKTVSEFIDLARTFTNNNPNGDGSRTYGFAMTNVVPDNMVSLLGAYGVPSARWGGIYYRRDGQITHSYIQPENKIVLEILRDMFAEGLIDPEFIVKGDGELENDFARHVIGMYDYRNWGTWYPFNFTFESDGVITRPYPIPKVDGIDYKMGIANNFGGMLFMLNSRAEHPEAFVKILNLYNKLVFESTDPNDFTTYWDNGQAGLAPVRVIIPNEIFAPQIHAAMRAGNGDDLPAMIRPFFDFTINFENGTDRSPSAYGTWGQNFERGSMAIALEYVADGAAVMNYWGLDGFVSQAALDNGEILGTLVNVAFLEFVTGARSLDTWDSFVQDWYANGGQLILDELNEYYN